MDKKIYVSPLAELVIFVPTEETATSWNWGDFAGKETASVTGLNDVWNKPWMYDDSTDPY